MNKCYPTVVVSLLPSVTQRHNCALQSEGEDHGVSFGSTLAELNMPEPFVY